MDLKHKIVLLCANFMMHNICDKIKALEIQLKELDIKKTALQKELKKAYIDLKKPTSNITSIEIQTIFSSEEKINIFMNLFRGRTDVFPKRWDNSKTGKSGYSPACSNE